MPIFKNFKEMEQTLKAEDKENIEKEKQLRAEKFNEVVKDGFGQMPMGFQFVPNFQNIDSISIIKPEKENILNITISYRGRDGKPRHFSLSMAEQGKLSAKLPAELEISQEQLYDEVLNALKLGIPTLQRDESH